MIDLHIVLVLDIRLIEFNRADQGHICTSTTLKSAGDLLRKIRRGASPLQPVRSAAHILRRDLHLFVRKIRLIVIVNGDAGNVDIPILQNSHLQQRRLDVLPEIIQVHDLQILPIDDPRFLKAQFHREEA